jgi:hypothetical protein
MTETQGGLLIYLVGNPSFLFSELAFLERFCKTFPERDTRHEAKHKFF